MKRPKRGDYEDMGNMDKSDWMAYANGLSNYCDSIEALKKENEELNKLKESFPDGIGDYEWKVIENYNSKNFVITELQKENEELKAELEKSIELNKKYL